MGAWWCNLNFLTIHKTSIRRTAGKTWLGASFIKISFENVRRINGATSLWTNSQILEEKENSSDCYICPNPARYYCCLFFFWSQPSIYCRYSGRVWFYPENFPESWVETGKCIYTYQDSGKTCDSSSDCQVVMLAARCEHNNLLKGYVSSDSPWGSYSFWK